MNDKSNKLNMNHQNEIENLSVVNQFSFKEDKLKINEKDNFNKDKIVDKVYENDENENINLKDNDDGKVSNIGKKLQIKSRTKNQTSENYNKLVKTSAKKLIKSDDDEDFSNQDNVNFGDIFMNSNDDNKRKTKK